MSDWLLSLPMVWMALVVFAGTYFVTAVLYWVITRLAVNDRALAFKALSPGMLPPLEIIFGLLVGFIAAQVWSDFDRAKLANRSTCAIALTLFATGIALSVLLIASYSRPFAGDISVGPELLQQVLGRQPGGGK